MKTRIFSILVLFGIILFSWPLSLFSAQEKMPGDESSISYVQQAWLAYDKKDYETAEAVADRCIARFDTVAKDQQASLPGDIPDGRVNQYWQLNEVATAKFIKGKIYMERGDYEKADVIFIDITKNYKSAMSYDPRGWYWSIAKASNEMLMKLKTGVDFGDGSSSFLTTKAWAMYNEKKYQDALLYAEKCIELYNTTAIMQQKSLLSYPKLKDIPKYWALNDVGTCYYIAGLVNVELGDWQKARDYFTFIKEFLPYASSWDNGGWYWKVAKEAETQLKKL